MPKVFFTEEVTEEEVNPYEAVLLSAKESRRLNQTRLNAGVPEGEEKVTTVALDRLMTKKIQLTYDPDAVENEDAASGETDSSGS